MSGASRAPRAVVFDLDGTLIDSRGDIVAAARHALEAHGFAAPGSARLLSFVGDGARLLLARAVNLPPDAAILDPLLTAFLEYYEAHPVDHTRFCAGAEGCLQTLAGVPLALCTNKPRTTTNAVLAALGLDQAFRVVIAGGDLPAQKPDPAPLHAIAAAFALPSAALVMVGDGPQDILAGRRAGARTVGVLGGIQADAQALDPAPDALIADLNELPALLTSWGLKRA